MADDFDDLDAVLRRTMATLDRQAPAGYFEALPARTLARLDDPAIGAAIGAALGAPPGDAGLQDIRDLASETRARLSSQRAAQDAPGTSPGTSDDAAVSSVSKAVAMPGPVRAAAEADAPQVQAGAPPPASAVSQPPTSLAGAAGQPATAVSQPSRPAPPLSPTASPVDAPARAAPRRHRPAVWAALAGGLAAAGAVGYLALGSRQTERADVAAIPEHRAEPPTTTVLSADQGGSKAGSAAVIARGSVEPAAPTAAAPLAPTPAPASPDKFRKTEGGSAAIASLRPPAPRSASGGGSVDTDGSSLGKGRLTAKRPSPVKPTAKAGPPVDPLHRGTEVAGAFDSVHPPEPAAGSATGSGAPAASQPPQQAQIPLDQLIGAGEKQPPPRPKPARTSLSTDDIKRGMTAVAGKAKACFNGTQGLAALRLTVAPSGRVVKAAVTGMFAGSPTGACVERAAGAARFPAWDGGPQSFNYSYLLSD